MKSEKEAKIQQDAVIWFNNHYCLKFHNPRFVIFSVPNEGESSFEVKRKMDRGMLPGVSDLIILGKNLAIFAECKTPTGVQSNTQKDFQIRVTELGFTYFIFRSLEEFKDVVKYLIK